MPNYYPKDLRNYYEPSLLASTNLPDTWSDEPPEDFFAAQNPWTKPTGFAAGVVAFAALGFAPIGNGERVWDLYAKGARAIEEYSPAHILRTFQVSTLLSQFEKPNLGTFIKPELLQANETYATYLAKLISKPEEVGRIATEGVTLRGGKLYWGEGTEVALKHAGAIRQAPGAATWLGKGWAAAVDTPVGKGKWQYFFTSENPLWGNWDIVNPTDKEGFVTQIVGGQTRRQYAARWASAGFTEGMGRFNRLLEAPAGFPVLENIYNAVQKGTKKLFNVEHIGLGVKEGTGVQMLGRFMGKYGLALPAAYMGYKTLDWMIDDSFLTRGTIFQEGLTTGIATVGVKANLAVSKAAEWTGGHWYREKQEEIAPGSTNLTKLLAFPLMGAVGAEAGLYAIKVGKMAKMQGSLGVSPTDARIAVEESMKYFGEGRGFISRTARYLAMEQGGLYEEAGWLGNLWRKIAVPAVEEAQKISSISPTKFGSATALEFKGLGRMTPAKLAGTIGLLAGAALTLPFLPGALVPSERPEELEDIYAGRKEIAVRGGRWWEFGKSAFEGNKINYFRPHWYARMRTDAREKGIWGDEAESLSPIRKWFKQEFTYDLEKEHYYDRPYPITALPFEDVPILGPIIANTIGRIIKPPRLMHKEEWQSSGGEQIVQPPRFGDRIATEIGESPPGQAETPYNIAGTAGEQIYRMTELVGLPGFMESTFKERLTGSGDWFDQTVDLESSRRMFGFERKYWDLELGGLAGTTEAFRRLYPHRRRQIPLYNPIRNTMPEWLPGPGEKAPDFLHGDLYTKVPEGELRLPGRGYEARYPELEGVASEDYPLIHRFKILADVGLYSSQFNETNRIVQAARNTQEWTDTEEEIYQQVKEQMAQRKQKKTFSNYQYLSPMGEVFGERQAHWGDSQGSALVTALNESQKEKQGEKGVFARLFGGYWEALSHNAETSLDQMIPMSPGAKLVHQRTAIEDYERMQVYGSENAFWNHPVRDFFRPTKWLVARSLGYDGIPTHIQNKRNLEEYFDTLKYVKAARLANIARIAGDTEAVREFENQKDKTLFGINPFTRNFSSIFNALPRSERDYFNAFAAASTPNERQEILSKVPDNERSLYMARWKILFGDEIAQAAKQGRLNEKALGEADKILIELGQEASTEGMPLGTELQTQYLKERNQGESYADWYRRRYLLSELPSLPGPDWVGWHPSVDLDDIKLQVVQTIGEDIHSYDLWQSQVQGLAQKPYINDAAIAPIVRQEQMPRSQMHDRIDELLFSSGVKGHTFSRTTFGSNRGTTIDVDLEQESNETALTYRILNHG